MRCPDVDDRVKAPLDRRGVPDLKTRGQGACSITGLGNRVRVEVDAQSARSGVPAQHAQQDLATATAGIEHERV